MAEQDKVPTPAAREVAPRVIYLNGLPSPNGNVAPHLVSSRSSANSIAELRIDLADPNRATAVPAPGADETLIKDYRLSVDELFTTPGNPQQGQKYIHVEEPAIFEREGETWKLAERGKAAYSDKPQLAEPRLDEQTKLTARAEELAGEMVMTTGADREAAEAELEIVADRAQAGPDAAKADYADELRDKAALDEATAENRSLREDLKAEQNAEQAEVKPEVEPESGAGELQIQWKQKGDEIAPVMEMRAYLDQFKDAGVAVGAMKMERGDDGKLRGSFGVSYDPQSHKIGQLEATLQGLKQVGNGVEVVEKASQTTDRRQAAGYDDDYESKASKQVKEAFGVKQWDALAANLSTVPKSALTAPEQVQQRAGDKRVEQIAQQQGRTKEQVLQDGKSVFDIDTSGNPASAFLKNFYAHLNGNPKMRQSLEVDYDKTREALQARLRQKAGSAPLDQGEEQVEPTAKEQAPDQKQNQKQNQKPEQKAAETMTPVVAPAGPANPFQAADVPQKVLASLGLTTDELKQSGQLEKLLAGEKTDLLPMQVAGQPGKDAVKFEAKMILHREANGTATLKMELPQDKLVITNGIGGQPFTPEQRKQLETQGTAGLVRGLKDEQGQTYNGYVAVDKTMNRVVVLPENKVKLQDTIAGVKLTQEQSRDLKEGKAVPLSNMTSSNGGRKFDGTVQVNAAKASIEIRPAAHELAQRHAPKVEQVAKKPAVAVEVTKAAPTVKRGPRR